MKRLYLIGGPMGVGKSAACRCLQQMLQPSVLLDGDWCWDAHPFQVTEETRDMVMDNITHLLRNFLRCSAYDHVIFCWVLHRREIWQDLLERLDTRGCAVTAAALVCTPESLLRRVEGDIAAGRRETGAEKRSLSYLPLYEGLQIPKLDTTALTPRQTAREILKLAREEARL